MTTPHQHSERQHGERQAGPQNDGPQNEAAQPAEPTAIPEDQVVPQQPPDQVGSPAATPGADAPAADSGRDDSLFTEQSHSELRARWIDVQATFVDDPRECVQKADRLVSAAVEQLTTGFADTRARLEDQWSRGEEASTEDLRIALKRYREFFERLLAV
jgi:hypothetical protein